MAATTPRRVPRRARWALSASRWVGMTGDGKGPAGGVVGALWWPGFRGGGRVLVVSRCAEMALPAKGMGSSFVASVIAARTAVPVGDRGFARREASSQGGGARTATVHADQVATTPGASRAVAAVAPVAGHRSDTCRLKRARWVGLVPSTLRRLLRLVVRLPDTLAENSPSRETDPAFPSRRLRERLTVSTPLTSPGSALTLALSGQERAGQ